MQIYMKEWMDIAKKYGAIFENVKLVHDNGSFTVKAIDREKESILDIPFPILLSEEAIEVTDDLHRVRENFDLAPDLRGMLDDYLAFILDEERIARLENLLNDFIRIPEVLKREIASFSSVGLYKKLNRRALKVKLIHARTIDMNGEKVFMPFIDFINHSFEEGIRYKIGINSIIIRGNASLSNELFAVYNHMPDAFFFMKTYMFSPVAINAQSMNVSIQVDEHTQLVIGRQSEKMNMSGNWLMEQEYCVSSEKIILPVMWIGSHDIPRNPFWSFKRLWEEKLHRNDTLRIYSIIKSLNITKLVSIVRLCNESEENQAITMVRECALQQLTLIGEGYEEIRQLSSENQTITMLRESALQQLSLIDEEYEEIVQISSE